MKSRADEEGGSISVAAHGCAPGVADHPGCKLERPRSMRGRTAVRPYGKRENLCIDPRHFGDAAEEFRQSFSFLFCALLSPRRDFEERRDLDEHLSALAVVAPDARHLAVDQQDGGQPALVAIDQ